MAKKPKLVEDFERVQVGLRLEKRMVKVLKGLAEYCDVTFNDLVEDMLLHELEGHGANALGKPEIKVVVDLKKLYNMTYGTHATLQWREANKPVDS